MLVATAILVADSLVRAEVGVPERARLFVEAPMHAALLFVAPAVLLRCARDTPLTSFGFAIGRARVWRRDAIILFALLAPLAIASTRLAVVHEQYPRYVFARESAFLFAASTLAMGVHHFAWEGFFRGCILFGVARREGPVWAIVVSTVPFALAHVPKGMEETLASIPGGLLFGVVAWRGRSMLPTWLLHWSLATLVNAVAILWPLWPRT